MGVRFESLLRHFADVAKWQTRSVAIERVYRYNSLVNRKYTKEVLAPIVADSVSVSQVLRGLGLKPTGGSHYHITRLIREFGIDATHFLGKTANRGERHTGGPEKKSAKEILILQDPLDRPIRAVKLRRAMLESGVPLKCEICGLGPEWNGKSLTLQVDHRNGRRYDSRPANVRFLCPNCHSQTETWGALNKVARV